MPQAHGQGYVAFIGYQLIRRECNQTRSRGRRRCGLEMSTTFRESVDVQWPLAIFQWTNNPLITPRLQNSQDEFRILSFGTDQNSIKLGTSLDSISQLLKRPSGAGAEVMEANL